jgi:hypothetical protein
MFSQGQMVPKSLDLEHRVQQTSSLPPVSASCTCRTDKNSQNIANLLAIPNINVNFKVIRLKK